ncbi:DUF1330 domain-containing protein [Alphaproteobacteria bacterium]|nr:DUF1330 domain-containing protein [Alphaproteobacteria bacterium]
MPKGYRVVSYRDAPNDENLGNHAPKAMRAMTNVGAKFIARGMPVATFENGIQQRTVIVEFESTDAARATITSDAYQAAFALLGNVKRDVRVIEGLE